MKGILIVFYFCFPPSLSLSLSPCLPLSLYTFLLPSLPPSLSLPSYSLLPSLVPFLPLPPILHPSIPLFLSLSLSPSLPPFLPPSLLFSLPPSLREATPLPTSSLQRYSLRQKEKVQYEEDVISDDVEYLCKYY